MRISLPLPLDQWRALQPFDAWLWVSLGAQVDADGWMVDTLEQLAVLHHCSVDTLRRALRRLEAANLVRHRPRGSGRQYGIVPSPDKKKGLPRPRTRQGLAGPSESGDTLTATDLVKRHAAGYTDRFGQPFLVAWARDTKIYKRLLDTYGMDAVIRFQTLYLSQSLDSFAATRGFSVPQFAAEIGGLAARSAVPQHPSYSRFPADEAAPPHDPAVLLEASPAFAAFVRKLSS
ncbi:hypothetical protein [Sulfobacillus thermosulfidooxidans]|uniref:hypothetical protein n=1 Tax=Sulfobacillus thermosulfidooxidans TaxID=28034 RepID=UPI0002F70036|nr:hypothetical protein [Sulfobacillus thermosulfidooxidans]